MKRNVRFIMLVELIALIVVVVFNLFLVTGTTISIQYLIDLPSLFLIVLFVVPGLVASGLWKDLLRAFSVGRKEYSVIQLQRMVESISMTEKLAACSCCFAVIIAAVMILASVDKLELLGPNMAVVLISILYYAMIEFFLVPLKSNIKIEILEKMEMPNEEE